MSPTLVPRLRTTGHAAAELTGFPKSRLESLIQMGNIQTERIMKKTFVDIDIAERVAREESQ